MRCGAPGGPRQSHCTIVHVPLQEMAEDKTKLEEENADLKQNNTELLARAHELEQSLSEAQARASRAVGLPGLPGAVPTVLSVLPVQMWQQRAQSRRRCGTPRCAGGTRV